MSQKLNFDIYFPHPLGYSTGINWKYNFETINALYTREEKIYSIRSFFPLVNNLELGYVSGSTFPTTKGENNGYKINTFQAFLFSIVQDKRDKRFLATDGFFISNEINIGLQNSSSYFDFKMNIFCIIFIKI